MRIISGSSGGRRLFSLPGLDTRPTTDKVKESLFNILAPYIGGGECVLDLFAGSGALGLECLSRGADTAVFVEKNPAAANIVRKNIELLGYGEKSRIVRGDYLKYLAACSQKFDLVFIDPPYKSGFYDSALCVIRENKLLADGGIVILERETALPVPDLTGYEILKDRQYKTSAITLLTLKAYN